MEVFSFPYSDSAELLQAYKSMYAVALRTHPVEPHQGTDSDLGISIARMLQSIKTLCMQTAHK